MLERVFGDHEQVGARVLDVPLSCGLQTSDLGAIVTHSLGKRHVEDGEATVWIQADQDRCSDLREDLVFLLKSFLDIE